MLNGEYRYCVGTKPMFYLLFTLQKIAGDLRSRVPFEAIVPSEKIIFPSKGEDSGKWLKILSLWKKKDFYFYFF